MNSRLFSIHSPVPAGFTPCSEFRIRDFRISPFVLYADSQRSARDFLGSTIDHLTGIILVPAEHIATEELSPRLTCISVTTSMLPYLASFANHQLAQIDQFVTIEDRTSLLQLENERLIMNNRRASEDFERYRASLIREIEERKLAERQLAESEERLQLIMSSTGEAIYGIDIDGACIFANAACIKMLGYTDIQDVMGRNMHELIHYKRADGSVMPVEECNIFKALRDGAGVTASDEFFFRHDGTSVPVEYSSSPILKNGVLAGAVVTWHDITTRRQRENSLKLSEEKFRSLVEASIDVIFVLDTSGVFQFVSPAWEKHFGYPIEKVLHQSFAPFVHPDDIQPCMEYMTRILSTGEASTSPRYRVLHNDGDWRVFIANGSRYLDNSGALFYLGIGRDITDQIKAEEEKESLEQQLLQAQKLESLGVLAGGIAHDFNNILLAIMGNAELAKIRLRPEFPARDNLIKIEKSAARAADLAKQMLAYSGKGKFIVEQINLNVLLEDMIHLLEVSISKKAILRCNLNDNLPTVKADATQMRQIIMNLVINSSEAIGEKSGVIAITTGCMDCDQSYLKNVWLDENLSDGLYVYLEVADTGCGMDKGTLTKLFDPFFTTKFTGRGLGMAAVLGIVRGHKGAIKVYSEQGKGTTFKILLPASGKPAKVFNGHNLNHDWQGSGTVLLVDDEENVRGIGTEMLKELGFQTITATDGRDALEKFREHPEIDFVILDLTMPKMDGEQCFRELRRLRPEIKVIMSSGYSEQEVSEKFLGKRVNGFIQKPYRLSALQDTVKKIG